MMKGSDDLEGKNENYICTLLDEDGWECGQRWPTARALAAHQRHTQGEPKRVASLVVTNQCFWCGSTHASIETTSKHMAAAERHNRYVVDAGRFHCLVIDIPPDTICPRCDLIFSDTAEHQRHLASVENPPPEGHSSVINAETSVGASGSGLWQNIRDRWRARRQRRKTHQVAAWRDEGRRGDWEHELGAEGICQGRQQKHGHKATQRRPQDAMRALSARGAVFMCWMIKQEAKPKEQLRTYSELAATKGKCHGLGPPGIAAFTGLLQALSERGSTVGAANAAEVANLKQTCDDRNRRELSIWYLIASWPKCTTQL